MRAASSRAAMTTEQRMGCSDFLPGMFNSSSKGNRRTQRKLMSPAMAMPTNNAATASKMRIVHMAHLPSRFSTVP